MNPKSRFPHERFIGEAIKPVATSFAVAPMARGEPGLPRSFSWQGRTYTVLEVVAQWKEAGACRHGSGERYVRKHWYHLHTTDDVEMKIYFERQQRGRDKSRWRLYSVRQVVSAASHNSSAGRIGAIR